MTSQEVDFLRDQVERLNIRLAKYQEQILLPLQQDNSEKAARPWLTNREFLSPLMREYDGIVQQLEQDTNGYKGQINNLRDQLKGLVSENDRLRQDLKDALDHTLAFETDDVGTSGISDFPAIKNLQLQLQLALKEKDACQERWRETAQELDRMVAELETQKESHQWRSVEKQVEEVRDQYLQSVSLANAQLENLQSDLRQARQELASSQRQVTELKKANHLLQQQLTWRDEEKAEKIFKDGITDSRMAELQRIIEDLRQRISSADREIEESRREKSIMEARIAELSRRLIETEQREMEAIHQRRDAEVFAESSALGKDQAAIAIRHKEEEVSKLKDSIAKVINEAGIRTRKEVDIVRKQCNDRVAKLTEELHNLEMDNTQKESQLERLLREKRAVESELKKITQERKQESLRIKESMEDFSRRVSTAERSRDDFLIKMEHLQNVLAKERDEHKQQKDSFEAKLQQVQERLSAMQQEYNQARDEQLQHADTINTLNKKLLQAQQEKDSIHRKFLKELALVEQEQQTKTRGFEVQLQTTEDARRTSVAELRKLLTAQQRMSARLKEECHTIKHKLEGKMEEMRADMNHLQQRNEELMLLLKQSQIKVVEAENVIKEYTKKIHHMEASLRKAESRSAEAAKQMSRHHVKERQLACEKQSLMNELSQSSRERNRGGLTNELLSGSHHLHQGTLELDELRTSS
ncbi:sodium channel and clathrin linker 1-like isoform X1 [Pomacea canaliculata]|uniref:sodium channel and clathrin linker 1-like isoform X1 n=2 Tax=Pomacea canaliculata TaxID=400727 RepID=UPI000D737E16|nr:sodium channel and clathrin linker 1-like isoform X1 [Pomacea canaliculata]